MDLLTPSSPEGVPTLSLTTHSSWLPWGRVAMPLISPASTSAKAADPTKLLLLNKRQERRTECHRI